MEQQLSAADAALRERITELSVHLPCGGIRGPLQLTSKSRPDLPVTWQSCRHEDSPQTWPGSNVSREYDLCAVCFRGTAGGRSRWAWIACEDCREVNTAMERAWGFRPFALGRHSLMNGIGIRAGLPSQELAAGVARLVEFARGDDRLRRWRAQEYTRLAAAFDSDADVPLREWRQEWPGGRSASIDAFSRVLDLDLEQLHI